MSKQIREHFQQLDRRLFMEKDQELAANDIPLSIGHGQTISQPTLVLNMTLALDLHPSQRVLEIGTGSGYQTAMIAPFVKELYTVERIEALYQKAKKRFAKFGYENVFPIYADGSKGYKEKAPYDRIIVTAASEHIPETLISQIAPGGRMIIPIGTRRMQKLQQIDKDDNSNLTIETIEYVLFVPLKPSVEKD
ncbi:protein-L-isoaspartate(D-aspartate) O-methyltransferase [Salisediminibacterium halotolerans]|uniref:protein-L-isoaspartate(D-aspartate) O-methyltransferase n=1 Tax=Salisediminibacterium halotolerans TaxID=517425 RepID=UPI000EB1F293|nr:protein-L-isoaspartate(D-aspartate) O-methyltransferase [Salisediminibacterium halotolerans]RLJ81080.1 protein-L-isoaspartate(D-aspartate) O-methyltransferase [Actinophytocola xinjiangensis]RPE84111.1 protein-L-isoaspartate(D-aspartate) O-methyltransferase [Salisediminibacterium halotolerans]TWG38507.1 protein-L-isoaspartate(D-aspartate) O-methyltransferase [Salisediminibacterium halotolerans]GEL08661.1 protein-L-isoaspartate O-methyltransferase [Salisediminibacterium halotolerans]